MVERTMKLRTASFREMQTRACCEIMSDLRGSSSCAEQELVVLPRLQSKMQARRFLMKLLMLGTHEHKGIL